jgi:glycine cleavage system H protein
LITEKTSTMYPEDAKYTKDHEWILLQGDTALVGITEYAQHELGDVVFVELPQPGASISKGQSFGVVESVKAASDLYAPVSGEVAEANAALQDQPDLVNKEPHAGGWMLKIRPANPADLNDLMSAADYAKYLETLH